MKLAHVTLFEDFGTRSVTIHGLMVVAFVNAILAGLFVEGQVGLVSFVALLNVTAGLWVAHSIHSLGNVAADGEYSGVLNELFDVGDGDAGHGFNIGRFGRLLGLIAVVTAVSLLTSAQALSGTVLSIAVVALGGVALVTAIIGFLIALGASYDGAQRQTAANVERYTEATDVDGGNAIDQ
ncbi:hypothetical protein ACFQO4_07140 [Saliphagus sp. GCM10025334]